MPIDLAATLTASVVASVVLLLLLLLLPWLQRSYAQNRSGATAVGGGAALSGPGGWLPLIGHMHRLGRRPYATLTAWRRLYGDVYKIYMGRHLAVVVNGADAVRQVCSSPAAAGRPHSLLSSWRSHRRYCAFAHGQRALRLRQAVARALAAAACDRSLLEAAALAQCDRLVDGLLLGQSPHSDSSDCGGTGGARQRKEACKSVFDVVHTVCFGKPRDELAAAAVASDSLMTATVLEEDPGDSAATNRKQRPHRPQQLHQPAELTLHQQQQQQPDGSTERLLTAIERMLRFASAASVGDFVPLSLRIAPSFRRHYYEFLAAQQALVSLVKDEERAHSEAYSEHYVRDVCDLLRRAADRDRQSDRQRQQSLSPRRRHWTPLPQARWLSDGGIGDVLSAGASEKSVDLEVNGVEFFSHSCSRESFDQQITNSTLSVLTEATVVGRDVRRSSANRIDEECMAAARACDLRSEDQSEAMEQDSADEEGEANEEEGIKHVDEDDYELTAEGRNFSDAGGDCTGSYVEQTGMLLVAGYDTVATALNWSLLLLAAHPAAQEELADRVTAVITGRGATVGGAAGNRAVCLADRDQLVCVDAFVCEVLRYACVSPLAMPHMALADISVRCDAEVTTLPRFPVKVASTSSLPNASGDSASGVGAASRHPAPSKATATSSTAAVVVPAGSLIMCNLWSVSRDAALWDAPDEFRPWRFMESAASGGSALSSEATRKLMSFGAGCRKCVGEQFARAELFLFVANVVRRCRVAAAAPLPDDLFAASPSMHVQPTDAQLIFVSRQT